MTRWLTFFLMALLLGAPLGAQTLDPNWNDPHRLSTLDGIEAGKSIVADSRGVFHVFWIEERLFENRYTLSYVQFDGTSWSQPVLLEDLREVFAGALTKLDVKIDAADTIHLIWGGNWAPIYYRTANARAALDPAAWSNARKIEVAAFRAELVLNVPGAVLVAYAALPNPDPAAKNGVFAVRSNDAGVTWSQPVQIDSNIPPTWMALDMDAEFDGEQALHLAWTYIVPNRYQVKRLSYTRSTDAGMTWSAPIVVDEAPEENLDVIRLAIPVVKARGSTVHIIWGGGGVIDVGRRHRISTDYGATWQDTQAIFGDLHGVAGNDTAVFDSQGRLHLFGQWRWPQGIYQAIWDEGSWTEPELIYLIARDYEEIIGDRIHSQYFRVAMSQGGRGVLAFETCGRGCNDNSTWPPNPIAFAMSSEGSINGLPEFTTVSSADFAPGVPAAPETIVAGFGTDLATDPVGVNQLPLPLKLGDIEVEVADSAGSRSLSELFFVSEKQINYLMPASVAEGPARVRVYRGGNIIAAGKASVARVAPAIFTVNAAGTGTAAALWLRVAANGTTSEGLVFDPQTFQATPVDTDPKNGQLYLIFYGTGFRRFGQAVTASLDGKALPVVGAAAQGQFRGVDQINIGPVGAKSGQVEIELAADGVKANRVTVLLK